MHYFITYDHLKYARPLYLAEIDTLKGTDPDIWEEFPDGNIVVNQSTLSLCAVGAEHSIEWQNRWMKVHGGLCGITLNAVDGSILPFKDNSKLMAILKAFGSH